MGDLNRDERVDETDVRWAGQMILGQRPPLPQADLNRDGNIDALDVRLIANEARR